MVSRRKPYDKSALATSVAMTAWILGKDEVFAFAFWVGRLRIFKVLRFFIRLM